MNKNFLSKSSAVFVLSLALMLLINQTAFAQLVCQPAGSPVVTSGSLVATDATQSARVFRDGIPTGCGGGAPTAAPIAGTFRADAIPFTSPVSGCATVDMNFTGCGTNSTQAVAYSTYNPASPGTGIIGHPGFSTTGTGSFSFPVTSGQAFTIAVNEIVANSGCANYSFTLSYSTSCNPAGLDVTNDGRADIALWTPSSGVWRIVDSSGDFASSRQFGTSGDITTAGDYTGDGRSDLSVYRPSNNTWYVGLNPATPNTVYSGQPFGTAGDIPVPGDFDRDSKTDYAVFRPSNGFWYALRSSDNTLFSRQWGASSDTPVVGDFDGDRINDLGVVRTVDNVLNWYILYSNFGYTQTYPNTNSLNGFIRYGAPTDKLVPGDYDGDGKTDIAIWRPSDGNWFFIRSNNLTATSASSVAFQFGANGDIPQPADYDGDRKTDFAVFRPSASQSVFYSYNSATNSVGSFAVGAVGDQPATTAYRVQ